MNRVAVLGNSDRIKSLVSLLTESKTDVVTASIASLEPTEGLKETPPDELKETHLIFLHDETPTLRETAFALGDFVSGRHAIVHLIHDLEPVSNATPGDVIECETATHRVGFLTGPMRADDVCSGLPSSGLIASPFSELRDLVASCVVNQAFRIYTNTDLRGAEYVAAYVRIIAFAAGISHASNLGESVLATLFARGLAEASRFSNSHGGNSETPHGLAGAANLFLDATAPGSVDFKVGVDVVQNGFDRGSLEARGPETASLLRLIDNIYSQSEHLDGHILKMCAAITSGDVSPADAVAGLMTLPILSEQ